MNTESIAREEWEREREKERDEQGKYQWVREGSELSRRREAGIGATTEIEAPKEALRPASSWSIQPRPTIGNVFAGSLSPALHPSCCSRTQLYTYPPHPPYAYSYHSLLCITSACACYRSVSYSNQHTASHRVPSLSKKSIYAAVEAEAKVATYPTGGGRAKVTNTNTKPDANTLVVQFQLSLAIRRDQKPCAPPFCPMPTSPYSTPVRPALSWPIVSLKRMMQKIFRPEHFVIIWITELQIWALGKN